MKKICFLLAALVLAACSSEKMDSVRITAQIQNPSFDAVEIFYYSDYVVNQRQMFEAQLDEAGQFVLDFPLDQPRYVHLSMPGRSIRLYLRPGADVSLMFDAEDLETMPVVDGILAGESQFLLAYNEEIEKQYARPVLMNRASEMEVNGFVEMVNEAFDARNDYLNRFPGLSVLDPGFIALMQTQFLYEKYGMLMEFPVRRALSENDLPEDYYDFLSDARRFSDEYLESGAYRQFLSALLHHSQSQLEQAQDAKTYYTQRYQIADTLFEGRSRELMLSNIMISVLNFIDFQTAETLYQEYLAGVSGQDRAIVEAEYRKVLALSPGNPAPPVALTDINGKAVSLEEFKGKVVYLDFWASWCGPCMREVPYARELKERMKEEEDLVFFYISVDTDAEAWRNTVSEKDIRGVHVNVAGFQQDIPLSYNLKGVPTFYVIGRDGNIFDNRPPRPSNPDIDQVLLKALQQS